METLGRVPPVHAPKRCLRRCGSFFFFFSQGGGGDIRWEVRGGDKESGLRKASTQTPRDIRPDTPAAPEAPSGALRMSRCIQSTGPGDVTLSQYAI